MPFNQCFRLHERLSSLLKFEAIAPQRAVSGIGLGIMQNLNQFLMNQPLLNFCNIVLRGISQVVFINNPISGFLMLIAMFIQSSWLGTLALIGVVSATIAAMFLNLNSALIQDGITGFNGMLVGGAIAYFSLSKSDTWNQFWMIVVVILSIFTVLILKTLGRWFVVHLQISSLSLAYNLVTLPFLLFILVQTPTVLRSPFPEPPLNGLQMLQSVPSGVGQVYFVDQGLSILLVILAVAICTPIGAMLCGLGCAMSLLAGVLLNANPEGLSLGLYSYNAVLTAISVGGVFYVPTCVSVGLAAGCAFLTAILDILLRAWWGDGLPVLSLPFVVVTMACFVLSRRLLPSLIPVPLQCITTPEEHRLQFQRHLQN